MSAQAADRPEDDGEFTGWTDPRYADMVAKLDAARLASPRRDGAQLRGFVFELPEDRRPPSI